MEEKVLILVVEDEALIRMGAVQMLEEAGFAVIEAWNAHDAMEVLEKRTDVRAVFTDVNMRNVGRNATGSHDTRPLASDSPDCDVRDSVSRCG